MIGVYVEDAAPAKRSKRSLESSAFIHSNCNKQRTHGDVVEGVVRVEEGGGEGEGVEPVKQ